MGADFSWETI